MVIDEDRRDSARRRAQDLLKLHGTVGAAKYCIAAGEVAETEAAIEYWSFVGKTLKHLTTTGDGT